uniref:m7GpppX diphosphatase n=1 Tax=Scylla olivacea TaxID=85551 RepID=A0A0P4WI46_SCYOL
MAEATAKGACSPPTKKQRTDDCSDAVDSTTDQGCVGDRDPHFLTSFKDFEVVRILNNDEEHKSVVVECQIKGKEGVAVAQLQKLPFNAQKLGDILSSGTTLKTLFQNDIYYNKTALVPPDLNEMKATIIYPAEEKHILRYEKQPSSFIQETPQLYREVTKRFIETSSLGKEITKEQRKKATLNYSGSTTSWTTRRRWTALCLRILILTRASSSCRTSNGLESRWRTSTCRPSCDAETSPASGSWMPHTCPCSRTCWRKAQQPSKRSMVFLLTN